MTGNKTIRLPLLFGLMLTVLLSGRQLLAQAAYDPAALAYPVQDAKDAFRQGNYEFVGIRLKASLEVPGLQEAQREKVKAEYRVQAVNMRWKTFRNVEDDHSSLLDLRRYCTRYNLTMWNLLQQKRREDVTRYRY